MDGRSADRLARPVAFAAAAVHATSVLNEMLYLYAPSRRQWVGNMQPAEPIKKDYHHWRLLKGEVQFSGMPLPVPLPTVSRTIPCA
jgi:hypothetical protein